MKMHETAVVDAPIEAVWPYVADPTRMSSWNDKLVSVDRSGRGEVVAGEAFQARYRLSKRESLSSVSVERCSPPTEVVYRHEIEHRGKTLRVQEIYRAEPLGGQTRVSQEIGLGRGVLPWWAVPIIWLISRIGSSPDGTVLEKLAEVVEKDLVGARPESS